MGRTVVERIVGFSEPAKMAKIRSYQRRRRQGGNKTLIGTSEAFGGSPVVQQAPVRLDVDDFVAAVQKCGQQLLILCGTFANSARRQADEAVAPSEVVTHSAAVTQGEAGVRMGVEEFIALFDAHAAASEAAADGQG